jgi:UDP-N-acetylglucosamine 2-epimerase (non-hydrolysing)
MHILHVVGARPNFMKAAPVLGALGRREGTRQTLVHTGQHYDPNMSEVFFNSTLAAALVCAKLHVPVGHVEAGLRSFDRTMPEEINRLVTDQLADLLFTPSEDADENLTREGVAPERIHRVGNVMIDTLVRLLPRAEERWPALRTSLNGAGNGKGRFGLVTLHRPSNVDDPAELRGIMQTLLEIARRLPLVFPVHPRTGQRLRDLGLAMTRTELHLIDPLGYLDCLALQRHATLVITDSGGIQEETTYLRVPCITVRENTERPITITKGTNVLVGRDMALLRSEAARVLDNGAVRGQAPALWDGRAGERIAEIVLSSEF